MPRTDRTRRDDTLGRILSYLVAITTILGIPVGLYGYFSAHHASRVDRTFEFYNDFRTAALQKDLNLLVGAWNAKADDEKKLLEQKDYDGFNQLVETMLRDGEARTALTEVIPFFDEIYSCVDHSLCDGNATIALLQGPATQIVSMFGSHLLKMQQTNPAYAIGVFKVRALSKTRSLF